MTYSVIVRVIKACDLKFEIDRIRVEKERFDIAHMRSIGLTSDEYGALKTSSMFSLAASFFTSCVLWTPRLSTTR